MHHLSGLPKSELIRICEETLKLIIDGGHPVISVIRAKRWVAKKKTPRVAVLQVITLRTLILHTQIWRYHIWMLHHINRLQKSELIRISEGTLKLRWRSLNNFYNYSKTLSCKKKGMCTLRLRLQLCKLKIFKKICHILVLEIKLWYYLPREVLITCIDKQKLF